MMGVYRAALALLLATHVQAVAVHLADKPPLSKGQLAKKKEEQIKAYIKKHTDLENGVTTPRPELIKVRDPVEIKLDGQTYPCQVTAFDRESGLFNVSFHFGQNKSSEVSGIPRRALNKITTADWMIANKEFVKKPEAFGQAVNMAKKLGKWNSLTDGQKLAARKAGEAKVAKVLGPKIRQPDAKQATKVLKHRAVKTKAQKERALAVKNQRVRNENEHAHRLIEREKEVAATHRKKEKERAEQVAAVKKRNTERAQEMEAEKMRKRAEKAREFEEERKAKEMERHRKAVKEERRRKMETMTAEAAKQRAENLRKHNPAQYKMEATAKKAREKADAKVRQNKADVEKMLAQLAAEKAGTAPAALSSPALASSRANVATPAPNAK